jgi:hypothetical protein
MSDERDEELVTAWMRELAALPLDAPPLPDAAYIWWKAQLLRQWDAQRTIVAPLEWGERAQVAAGLGGAAVLLLLSSPHLPVIATGVLVLTAVVAVGWWRQSLTTD